MTESPERHPRARRSNLLLVAILVIAAVARWVGSSNALWFDEIVTVQNYVRLPLPEIVTTYNAANNHVMNSALAHMAVQALGEQPRTVRLPAIVFGIGGVWAFAFVARTLWPSGVALVGTSLFAVSYHHVYYSQDARGYSAFLFFAMLSAGALFRFLRAQSDRAARLNGVVYALSIGFGTWALLLMAFVILGHAFVLLAAGRLRACR